MKQNIKLALAELEQEMEVIQKQDLEKYKGGNSSGGSGNQEDFNGLSGIKTIDEVVIDAPDSALLDFYMRMYGEFYLKSLQDSSGMTNFDPALLGSSGSSGDSYTGGGSNPTQNRQKTLEQLGIDMNKDNPETAISKLLKGTNIRDSIEGNVFSFIDPNAGFMISNVTKISNETFSINRTFLGRTIIDSNAKITISKKTFNGLIGFYYKLEGVKHNNIIKEGFIDNNTLYYYENNILKKQHVR